MQHPQSFNRSVLAQSYFPELKPMSAWKNVNHVCYHPSSINPSFAKIKKQKSII